MTVNRPYDVSHRYCFSLELSIPWWPMTPLRTDGHWHPAIQEGVTEILAAVTKALREGEELAAPPDISSDDVECVIDGPVRVVAMHNRGYNEFWRLPVGSACAIHTWIVERRRPQ